jgi:hypothetical protein
MSSIRKYEKNKENPFLKEAIQQINSGIVKKYKSTSGTTKNAILQAINSEGEVMGHTSFIQQIEVDEEKFTKLYLSQFSAFFELKNQGIKVFGYIMTKLIPKNDNFMFFLDECMEFTGYRNHRSIHQGITSLLENNIIARGRTEYDYFINPMVAFNGDRVTFAKTYVKKQKNIIKKDPHQIELFE